MALDREQALDELYELAAVEHAVLVDNLVVYGALGQDLDTASPAAGDAFSLSLRAMRRFRVVNEALVLAGRPPQTGRAALPPWSRAELERIVAREAGIAATVDARYERLRPAVEGKAPVFADELLFAVSNAVELGVGHADDLDGLRTSLQGVAPAEYLKASRLRPADDLERDLLELSDRAYELIVATVLAAIRYDQQLGGVLMGRALSQMDVLKEVNGLLVGRGLLPRFTATMPV
jgi:hypothetical protein